MFQKVSAKRKVVIVLVRTPEDLDRCDALVIPGGGESPTKSGASDEVDRARGFRLESTTIALLARLAGLLEPLKQFLTKKPVWGTCAGAILLSTAVEGAKKGGQELLGGVSVTIARNGWGSQVRFTGDGFRSADSILWAQVESFEAPLEVEGLREANRPFHGIFIRAPVRCGRRAFVYARAYSCIGCAESYAVHDRPADSSHISYIRLSSSDLYTAT